MESTNVADPETQAGVKLAINKIALDSNFELAGKRYKTRD